MFRRIGMPLLQWSANLVIGKSISHYRIVEKLGSGGMGVVYKAQDTKLDRFVALKFLPPHLSQDEDNKKRFIHEAKAASALNHPNIATIYEIDEADGQVFIAMEYVDGRALNEIVDANLAKVLNLRKALDIGIQIAEALSKAHAQGIIHRDIKPANILVTEDGVVKIVDFGLAKLAGRTMLTKEGTTLGTVAYMSPEQTQGTEVDHRTDIWSLGVVLYEMFTSGHPFRGDYEQAVLYSIMNEEPKPLTELRPGLSEDFEQVIRKALAKDPEKRYQEIEELQADLKALRLGIKPDTRRQKFLSKRKFLAGVSIAFAILISIWFVLQFRNKSTSTQVAGLRTAVAVLPFSIRGSEDFDYLGEGMVDLLSTKLDGAGDWRSVDPRAIIGLVTQESKRTLAPDDGRAIAEKLSAGFYVLGSMVEFGGKLQLSASLYSSSRGFEAVTKASAEGEAKQIFEMVDDVAAQLLASQGKGQAGRVTRIAAVTTSSLPALKAYLAGEKQFRAGLYEQAVISFQQAVAQDSLFALAHYRLSIAAEWGGKANLSRQAAEEAMRHSERLSPHEQRLLDGFLKWRQGRYAEAERVYRSIVVSYPDDIEAWIQLAEVLCHTNPSRGKSFTESGMPYKKILSYEPEDVGAMIHLTRVAAKTGHLAELDSLVNRILELSPSGDRVLEVTALQAFSHNDQEKKQQVLSLAKQTNDLQLVLAVWSSSLYSPGYRDTYDFILQLADEWRSPEARVLGYAWLAHNHLMKGQVQAAKTRLAEIEFLDPLSALQYRSIFSCLPFLVADKNELNSLLDELKNQKPVIRENTNPNIFFNAQDEIHPIVVNYLIGMIEAQLGNHVAATRYASKLDRLDVHPRTGSLAADLALNIRSNILQKQGRNVEALALLEQSRFEIWYPLKMASLFYCQVFGRFQRAGLLYELGRYDEAVRWYTHIAEMCPAELTFVPMSHFRLGEIYEKLNKPEKSLSYYSRFVEFWQDCDPELRPTVERARARITKLQELVAG